MKSFSCLYRTKGSKNIEALTKIMSRHYQKIKHDLGIDEALQDSSEDEQDEYIGK